ncbi:hypothetical protein JDV09_04345 [Mycobacterium sp. Y57]|uniref:hypothetical protein n=1 Tax=Mycolicibacterium xanthum TaxID=2796469 RepID=UPI001C8573F4|nr:hypothetical protein [Mycolicibacterium xanthum]MBX7431344.1 hypothetical protein [Mycolicibacterium xanthum]
MSSHEPRPDDDTGPVYVDRSHPASGAPSGRRFDAPLSVNPRPVQRDRRPTVLIAAATVAVIALGVLAWVFWPSSEAGESPAAAPTTTTETQSVEEAGARLMGMLPRGYDEGACEPVVPPKGALAHVICGRNGDPGGPLSAIYTLAGDVESLRTAFDRTKNALSVVNCPGNIQSPGPWRRNAAPDKVAGTLVCGFRQTTSTVAWTTDAQLLLSEVQSGAQGPNMVQLYTWWSSHS